MQIQTLNQKPFKEQLGLSARGVRIHILATVLIIAAGLQPGCDRSEQSIQAQREAAGKDSSKPTSSLLGQGLSPAKLVNSSSSAESIVAACVGQYRSLHSYQDQATVELHYLLDGQPTVDRAPMNVAWDQSGKIAFHVYSLIAGPTRSGRWRLRIDSNREEFQGQVISRFLPDKLDFDWLLSEPVIGEELAAGLAGFPPQLDLLLSPEPLAGLLQHATSVSLEPNVTIDGRACWSIVVKLKQLVYKLCIDQQSSLLRRIQLPTQNLPSEILHDLRVSDLQLIVDFGQIQINHAVAWNRFEVALNPDEIEVDRFVSRPPKVNLEGYGKIVPAFQLRKPDGQVGFDSRPNSDRKASVLIWLADHSSSKIAAEQLARATRSLKQEGFTPQQIDIVSVWAEPQAPIGLSFEQLQSEWQLPGQLVLDRSAAGRDLFGIDEAPTLIVLDAEGRLQLRDVRTNPLLETALPIIVARVANGENLSVEIQAAHDASQRRYRAELAMAMVASDRLEHSQDLSIPEYPPARVRLTETMRKSYTKTLRYMFQDARETPWVLMSDGSLNRLGASLTVEKSFQTSWGHASEQPVRIISSRDCRSFAYVANNKSNKKRLVQIFDSKSGQEIQLALTEDGDVVDICWLGGSNHRLAVITDSNQLIVFDLETQERFSGSCPQQPIALLDFAKSVILQDGTVEPIEFEPGFQKAPRELPPKNTSPLNTKPKLPFQPLVGPWSTAIKDKGQQLLAFGQKAKSEAALFLVNANLETEGSYRLPARFKPNSLTTRVAYAKSPGNGELVWAVLEQNGTVHLLRGDGGWTDHFRTGDAEVGICLVSAGDRLKLLVASREQIVAYQLD